MRLYITGCVGSGKSTLARRLSVATGIQCTHLDEIMYEPDPSAPSRNRKRASADRDRLFSWIISADNWIVEDAGRECFRSAMDSADKVIVLCLPRFRLYSRVIIRWIKQRLGIEPCIYLPTLIMLRSMIRWVGEYDTSPFNAYSSKLIKLSTQAQIEEFIQKTGSGS